MLLQALKAGKGTGISDDDKPRGPGDKAAAVQAQRKAVGKKLRLSEY